MKGIGHNCCEEKRFRRLEKAFEEASWSSLYVRVIRIRKKGKNNELISWLVMMLI